MPPDFALIFVGELTTHRNSCASFLDHNSRIQMDHHDPEVTLMLFCGFKAHIWLGSRMKVMVDRGNIIRGQ